jgi:hypothetical protein
LVCAGASVVASVSAVGTGPFAYQWYKNSLSTPAASQTASTLSLPGSTTADTGSYSVVVTGSCGSVTSTAFSLTVVAFPLPIISPSAVTICAGTSATLTASDNIAGRNTTFIWTGGATTAAISVSAAGTYSVTATVLGCSVGTTANVTVNPVTMFTTQPPAQSVVCIGSTATVNVLATGTGNISYQWFKNTTASPIVGQTGQALSLTNVQTTDAATYFCIATGACSVTTSTPFVLLLNTVYVTQAGAGAQNGSSWNNAYPATQLQVTINQAATPISGCATQMVWIAAGTYKPAQNTVSDPASRTISFSMKNNVWIYGGFVGNETNLGQRPAINPTKPSTTTLSGEIGNNDYNDNSIHVIENQNVDNTALLDGVVVMGGNASQQPGDELFGGGVYNNARSGGTVSPRFVRVWFTQNRAGLGGGMGNNAFGGGTIKTSLTACWFTQNTATRFGGGVYNDGNKGGNVQVDLRSCTFWNNTAIAGPAITSTGGKDGVCQVNIINNTIVDNRSQANPAAIVQAADNARTTIVNSIVRGNTNQQFCAAGDDIQPPTIRYSNIDFAIFDPTIINVNPLFVNVATGDLRLQPSSGVINMGDPTATTATGSTSANVGIEDGYGQARIVDGRVDIGAFEFGGPACDGSLFVTVKAGNWNDPTVWSCGTLPTAGSVVNLKHVVVIPTGYTALGGTLRYDVGSGIRYQTGGRLRLGQ